MLQPLLTLHSQELLLCGPTGVHLGGSLRVRGEGGEIREGGGKTREEGKGHHEERAD